ncbi:hypothetical protein WISP_57721 [Willisornis vidua]|uniref:Uncharacterized protein n=1 Tax=Willisornis vidua TaxID=1566151 RepID=A0ABQ9DH91_9PASS|nr:hypothetical protein WISP_57721 [Willisornis vidua]
MVVVAEAKPLQLSRGRSNMDATYLPCGCGYKMVNPQQSHGHGEAAVALQPVECRDPSSACGGAHTGVGQCPEQAVISWEAHDGAGTDRDLQRMERVVHTGAAVENVEQLSMSMSQWFIADIPRMPVFAMQTVSTISQFYESP